jgi:hypothetical protein
MINEGPIADSAEQLKILNQQMQFQNESLVLLIAVQIAILSTKDSKSAMVFMNLFDQLKLRADKQYI